MSYLLYRLLTGMALYTNLIDHQTTVLWDLIIREANRGEMLRVIEAVEVLANRFLPVVEDFKVISLSQKHWIVCISNLRRDTNSRLLHLITCQTRYTIILRIVVRNSSINYWPNNKTKHRVLLWNLASQTTNSITPKPNIEMNMHQCRWIIQDTAAKTIIKTIQIIRQIGNMLRLSMRLRICLFKCSNSLHNRRPLLQRSKLYKRKITILRVKCKWWKTCLNNTKSSKCNKNTWTSLIKLAGILTRSSVKNSGWQLWKVTRGNRYKLIKSNRLKSTTWIQNLNNLWLKRLDL